MFTRHRAAAFILVGSAFLAGCQQNAPSGGPDLGIGDGSGAEPVRESELRAHCPSVILREGTTFFRTYERGAEGDPDSIVYQASIADVTRACNYGEGAVTMTVAVAGKVVPGPKGRAGTITMPIRIAAVRGDQVLYSQLHQHAVTIGDTSGATQFLLSDPAVVIPGQVDRAVQIMVGYDEGPYDAQ